MLINKMFAAESKVDDNCHFEFPLYFHTNEFKQLIEVAGKLQAL